MDNTHTQSVDTATNVSNPTTIKLQASALADMSFNDMLPVGLGTPSFTDRYNYTGLYSSFKWSGSHIHVLAQMCSGSYTECVFLPDDVFTVPVEYPFDEKETQLMIEQHDAMEAYDQMVSSIEY